MIQHKLFESKDREIQEEKVNKFLKEAKDKGYIYHRGKSVRHSDFRCEVYLTEVWYVVPNTIEEWEELRDVANKNIKKLKKEEGDE